MYTLLKMDCVLAFCHWKCVHSLYYEICKFIDKCFRVIPKKSGYWYVRCKDLKTKRIHYFHSFKIPPVFLKFQSFQHVLTLMPALRSISNVGLTLSCSLSSTPVKHNSSMSRSNDSTTLCMRALRSCTLSLAW